MLLSWVVALSEWSTKTPELGVQLAIETVCMVRIYRRACHFGQPLARNVWISFPKFRWPLLDLEEYFCSPVWLMCLVVCIFCWLHSCYFSCTLTPDQIAGGKCDELSENYLLYLEKGILYFLALSLVTLMYFTSLAVCSLTEWFKFWFLWKNSQSYVLAIFRHSSFKAVHFRMPTLSMFWIIAVMIMWGFFKVEIFYKLFFPYKIVSLCCMTLKIQRICAYLLIGRGFNFICIWRSSFPALWLLFTYI